MTAGPGSAGAALDTFTPKTKGMTMGSILDSMKRAIAPLSERVQVALTSPDTPSATLAALHEEVALAQIEASTTAKLADAQALDPTLSAMDADNAAAAAQAASFAKRRLDAALLRLAEFRDTRAQEERQSDLWVKYGAAQKKRDAVAARISEEYPRLAREMLALIRAALDCAVDVDTVNRSLPNGAPMLDRPDGFARGFTDNGRDGTKGALYGALPLACAVIPDPDNFEQALWPFSARSDWLRANRLPSYEMIVAQYRDATR